VGVPLVLFCKKSFEFVHFMLKFSSRISVKKEGLLNANSLFIS
jgi:hypothetical protein